MTGPDVVTAWLRLATRREIVLRSTRVALVVGTLLALINHGDRLLGGGIDSVAALKIVLTYMVPYGVSTWAAVQTARAAVEDP
jgi:hypothetical protein